MNTCGTKFSNMLFSFHAHPTTLQVHAPIKCTITFNGCMFMACKQIANTMVAALKYLSTNIMFQSERPCPRNHIRMVCCFDDWHQLCNHHHTLVSWSWCTLFVTPQQSNLKRVPHLACWSTCRSIVVVSFCVVLFAPVTVDGCLHTITTSSSSHTCQYVHVNICWLVVDVCGGVTTHAQHQNDIYQFVHTHLLGQVNTMKQNTSRVTAGNIFLMLSPTFIWAATAPIMARVVNTMQGMKNGSYTMPITSKNANIGLSILIIWYTPSVNPASVNSCDSVWASPTRYEDATVVLKIHITMMDIPITSCNTSDNVKSITFMVILYTIPPECATPFAWVATWWHQNSMLDCAFC